MIRFEILTLFPDFFKGPLSESILNRACEKRLIDIRIINIRDFTADKHHVADDYPYGGGAGMVMKPEPIAKAICSLKEESPQPRVIFLTPQGKPFTQQRARELAQLERIVLLCGHYEGIDERVRMRHVDEEISIGDYVLTGGEAPALIVLDAVARMVPGVLGNEDSFRNDSFYEGILDYPHYTRPEEFEGDRVPETLLSGHHKKIEEWRRREALARTLRVRPDLLEHAPLSEEDHRILNELRKLG
ncbi:MAG: tRNA (guanine-N(1)-)-methyltransferase [candidate division BRC1 bacterium ADurb.Bin183]|nr:MAG: tRNA (guanine-N(1)-)-methyltransferase [candidate division BRC1 bacterium ADurb.Bin183]